MNQQAELSEEQIASLDILRSGENVFLTGGAGSGKSFLIRHLMRELDSKTMPILASTGVAAVMLGGRTFHSFFGLGIMDGGPDATFQRGQKDKRLMKRLSQVEGVIIDEISMISGDALMIAEALSQVARSSKLPWGGMRVIVVGDFAQLPPVTQGRNRDWCFLNPVWKQSDFQICQLKHSHRVKDSLFLDILQDVRLGIVSERVQQFFKERTHVDDESHPGTRLFPRRLQAETHNLKKLREIPEMEEEIPTIYFGGERQIEILKKSAPVPMVLNLRIGCKVMFLQNDPQKRWVNGTKGEILEIEGDRILVEKENGREVFVEKSQFSLQDADGNVVASAIQFPLNLAYATTIHKSQGATLEELWCDLSALWEPGQAYVALSRLKSPDGLFLLKWSPRSVITDPQVLEFYHALT